MAGASPPPRAARCPVLIASTGWTLTARNTGHSTATIGSTKPMAATPAKMPVWNGVMKTGSGTKLSSTPCIRLAISSPMPTPNTTPSTAIWVPTSRGRTAMARGFTPRAMDVPISRRWVSTIRAAKFRAAKAAPANSTSANTL